MPIYTFHRDGFFYPLKLRDDADAKANAECNPGTTKVLRMPSGRLVWSIFDIKPTVSEEGAA